MSETAIVISDPALQGEVADHLSRSDPPPLLIVLGDSTEASAAGVRVDARLPLSFKPARLRALLHHLLLEYETEPE